MKTSKTAVIKLIPQSSAQSDLYFPDGSVKPEIHHLGILVDLYQKCEDEPDFDCEFLYHAPYSQQQNVEIRELQSGDDFFSELTKKQWNDTLHESYLELV